MAGCWDGCGKPLSLVPFSLLSLSLVLYTYIHKCIATYILSYTYILTYMHTYTLFGTRSVCALHVVCICPSPSVGLAFEGHQIQDQTGCALRVWHVRSSPSVFSFLLIFSIDYLFLSISLLFPTPLPCSYVYSPVHPNLSVCPGVFEWIIKSSFICLFPYSAGIVFTHLCVRFQGDPAVRGGFEQSWSFIYNVTDYCLGHSSSGAFSLLPTRFYTYSCLTICSSFAPYLTLLHLLFL